MTPDAGNDPTAETVGMLPRTADPFVAWGQRAAILAKAKHPAAAKLFLNWQLSTERQTSDGWSVRTDVAPPAGLKRVWQYANADIDGFPAFMADRAAAERLRQQMTVYLGEVKGDPTPGRLGTHPGAPPEDASVGAGRAGARAGLGLAGHETAVEVDQR